MSGLVAETGRSAPGDPVAADRLGRRLPKLTHLDGSAPGIRRLGPAGSFVYRDVSGAQVGPGGRISRIVALHIPPAWTDVWISPDESSHLQATGHDAKGRKQYIYHSLWTEERAHRKFHDMLDFARALPRLRSKVDRSLAEPGLSRRRVMSLGIRLLDLGLFRIGTERYAERNHTFGLVSLLRDHVQVGADSATFDFEAKWAKRRVVVISDPRSLRVVAELKMRPGDPPQLMAFDHPGGWLATTPDEINNFLRVEAGGPFSAKEFRTWHATVIAATELAERHEARASEGRRRALVRQAMRDVASNLGNTPAVARASYVDPRVIQQFEAGVTVSTAIRRADRLPKHARQDHIEAAVIGLLSAAD